MGTPARRRASGTARADRIYMPIGADSRDSWGLREVLDGRGEDRATSRRGRRHLTPFKRASRLAASRDHGSGPPVKASVPLFFGRAVARGAAAWWSLTWA